MPNLTVPRIFCTVDDWPDFKLLPMFSRQVPGTKSGKGNKPEMGHSQLRISFDERSHHLHGHLLLGVINHNTPLAKKPRDLGGFIHSSTASSENNHHHHSSPRTSPQHITWVLCTSPPTYSPPKTWGPLSDLEANAAPPNRGTVIDQPRPFVASALTG